MKKKTIESPAYFDIYLKGVKITKGIKRNGEFWILFRKKLSSNSNILKPISLQPEV